MSNLFKIPTKPWREKEIAFLMANEVMLDNETRAELGLKPLTNDFVEAAATNTAREKEVVEAKETAKVKKEAEDKKEKTPSKGSTAPKTETAVKEAVVATTGGVEAKAATEEGSKDAVNKGGAQSA